MRTKGYILVEGHGEVQASQNLVSRIGRDMECGLTWTTPRRWPNLHQWEPGGRGGVRAGAEFIRMKPDAGALLILRDEDDACPKELAPSIAQRLRGLALPFPVAYVLLHPEYEVLFLPCLDRMKGPFPDGRAGLSADTRWDKESWESTRGIKEWLSRHFPKGRRYKPTVDQLPMTRNIDLETLRKSGVPCFGSLERAIRTLCNHVGQEGVVYP